MMKISLSPLPFERLCRNRGNCKKCHAEPCAELDSVLFRHLIKSRPYETLNQVQGDKIVITTQSLMGEGVGGGEKLPQFPLTSFLSPVCGDCVATNYSSFDMLRTNG
jgi:hypothetical protein